MSPAASFNAKAFSLLFRSMAYVDLPGRSILDVSEEAEPINRLSFVASRLWMPIEREVKNRNLVASESAIKQYAGSFLDRYGLVLREKLCSWLESSALSIEQSKYLFEFFFMYEQLVENWNVNFVGVLEIDVKKNWWKRAVDLFSAATSIEIDENWAKGKRDRHWRSLLSEPNYFKFGFENGLTEFHALAQRLA